MSSKKENSTYSQCTDDELIICFQQTANRAPLQALFERHDAKCRNLVFNFCKNKEQTDDIMQECFIRAQKTFEQNLFRGGSFGSWLGKVGVNIFRNEFNRKRSLEIESIDHLNIMIDKPAPYGDPLSLLLNKEFFAMIDFSLSKLDPLQRRFIELWIENGCDFNLIMEVIKKEITNGEIDCSNFVLSYSNMRTRASRAKKRFKDELTALLKAS